MPQLQQPLKPMNININISFCHEAIKLTVTTKTQAYKGASVLLPHLTESSVSNNNFDKLSTDIMFLEWRWMHMSNCL